MDVTKTITRNRICRFVVHTSAQTIAFDRNFDVGNSSVRSSIQTYDPWTCNFHTFTTPHPPLPSLKDQWLQYKLITYINRRKTYSALKKIVVSFHHPKEIAHLAFGCPLREGLNGVMVNTFPLFPPYIFFTVNFFYDKRLKFVNFYV